MSANIEESIEDNENKIETIVMNEDNEEKEPMEKPKIKKPRTEKQIEALKKAQEKLREKKGSTEKRKRINQKTCIRGY